MTRTDGRPATGSRGAARLTLDETTDGWRLTISASALERLAALADEDGGELIRFEGGELTVELHPNLVPGEPFDVTGVLISDEDAGEDEAEDETEDEPQRR